MHYFRATEAYINQEQAKKTIVGGPWDETEYYLHFEKRFAPESGIETQPEMTDKEAAEWQKLQKKVI